MTDRSATDAAPKPFKRLTECDRHVGSRIRMLRERRRMTQVQLGRNLGVSFQQLQKYEQGENWVSAGRLFEIAQFLGVEISFFFEGLPAKELRVEADAQPDQASELFTLFSKIKDRRIQNSIWQLIKMLASEKS